MSTPPTTPSSKPPGRLRAFFSKVLLLVVTIVLCVAVLEVGVRVLGMAPPMLWQPDPELGWRHIPGARARWTEEGDGQVRINALGYRDRDRSLEKPEGVFRIAVFGDSMTEGVQVDLEQTYTYLLEEKLSRANAPVEVLNFGMNGYGPIQELLLFRREVSRYQPDLVILATFVDNDIADCHRQLSTHGPNSVYLKENSAQLEFDQQYVAEETLRYHRQPIHSLRKYSVLYHVVRKALKRRQPAGQADPGGHVPRRYQLYETSPEARWEEAWKTYERILAAFRVETTTKQIPFIVLIVPAGQVVDSTAWENVLKTHPAMQEKTWDREGPGNRLLSLARKHDVLVCQPVETFRKALGQEPLFFGNVGHMTPKGHDVMASALERFVREKALLPKR
jgi:hypothetical protein